MRIQVVTFAIQQAFGIGFQDAVTEALLRQRFALLRQQLGSKLGQVCAILVSEQGMVDVRLFQVVAAEDELRVGIFQDEAEARRWLSAYFPTHASDP